MAEEVKYNNTLVSGRADETLTYTKYVKDESSGKSTKELLDEKVNKTDQLGTTQIADKAVTNEKLAEHSVDNSKLSPDSVSYDKIQNDAVITDKIQDNAVTTEKVEEKAITNTKLGDQSVDGRVVREASLETKHFANESVTTEKVARKSITKDKLADNAVDASQVVDGSIGNSKLSPDSVTTEKIKDSSVTNEKVANDTLGIEKFDPELRKTIQAATGLPDDLSQMIQDVDKSVKQLKEKDTDLQSQINDKQQQITANDGDISLLQTRSTQMEKAIKGISASGGASQASAVTYENTESGLDSVTAQGAIDELARKKIDKENISQEFGDSEDKVVSQFALPFREIESPEFIKTIVDSEDHFLFGIQLDGSIEWGKGIPAPIRAKLQEIIKQCQQDKTDILEAVNAAKEELSASITALQESKVDKEEGKSLIDDEVKECFRVIENEEFIKAIVDSDDKVLFGFYRATGKPYYPLNEMYHVEQNEEFFALWQDAANHVLLGIRRDGQIIGEIHAVNALKQVISQLQSNFTSLQKEVKDFLNIFSLQDNEEYLAVEQDAEGKILSATNPDGSHYIYNAKSETIPEEFSNLEDPEGRMEIVTDAEGKVMSYRDSQGKKHEHSMDIANLDISNLNLKGNSVNNIKDALKANGFDVKTPIDWSDSAFIQINEPRFAIVNITGIDSMPTSKTQNLHAWMEFWDRQGNYFKKRVIANAQGASSMADPKKNISIDICNDEWIGDDTTKVRIGDWVPQDSFHLKAYYLDFFRGVSAVCYKFYNEIVRTRGFMYDRPWKKALIDTSRLGVVAKSLGNINVGDFDLLVDNGARCVPDGFPFACYLNGEFYGVFSWQLKKHRDNYHLDKSTDTNIHLDGWLDAKSFWGGNINWSQFEVRNPKSLYSIGGNKYDADVAQEEIAGEEEVNSWIEGGKLPDGTVISNKIKKNLLITAKVKKYIVNLSNAISVIENAMNTYEASSKTNDDLNKFKAVYEKFFDPENIIDYIIFSDVTYNLDGFAANWQWFTYDGKKWWVGVYDCDRTFGLVGGSTQIQPLMSHIFPNSNLPQKYIVKYYTEKLNARYCELANSGILSSNHLFNCIYDWTTRIGSSFYKAEYEKWKDSPCASDSIISEYWEPLVDENGVPQTEETETFDATKSYNVGDITSFGCDVLMGFFKFKCIKQTESLGTNTPHSVSKYSPIKEFRCCDSIYRIKKWIDKSIINMDKLYKYLRN